MGSVVGKFQGPGGPNLSSQFVVDATSGATVGIGGKERGDGRDGHRHREGPVQGSPLHRVTFLFGIFGIAEGHSSACLLSSACHGRLPSANPRGRPSAPSAQTQEQEAYPG